MQSLMSLQPGITQTRVQLLSCAPDHSGTRVVAVTRVSTARHHSGTRVVAVTRVSTAHCIASEGQIVIC